MSIITSFLDWYERHMAKSLIVSAVILYAQIPHTITAAECFFGDHDHTLIFGKNIILDFLLDIVPLEVPTCKIFFRSHLKDFLINPF